MSSAESLLQLKSGSKAYGARELFVDASFAINEDEHVGVIGPNGAGKSTLFKILLDEEELDAGSVVRSKRLTVGYLSQHDHWIDGETGNSYLERVATLPVWETKGRGRVLQLSEEVLARPILSLSGGYRMRIKLLGLIGQNPNLMLLDEPTNYLDLETTLVLERFLQGFEGAFLLISHDREFLRRTTDHILEIEQKEVTKFNGNIDDYFEQKEMLRAQTLARAQSLSEKRAAILEFVNRFGAKATKARQAQSRLKTLAKMETIEVKALPVSAAIRIPVPPKTGKLTVGVEQARFGYGDRAILDGVSFQVLRGDHVAVVGLNGAGKSTLLKGLAGKLSAHAGSVQFGFGVDTALFAQHVVEELDPNDTVLDSLSRAAYPGCLPQEVKDLAGSLLFSGDDIKKRISVLSGGEKSRVSLGRVLLKRTACLILDEPTNHLDFQTVEALTQALQRFEGTVITVSHDRSFIRRVATKILEVDQGRVRLYPGTYDEYVWNLEKSMNTDVTDSTERRPAHLAPVSEVVSEAPRENRHLKKKELEKALRSCEKKISENERAMAQAHREVSEFNAELAKLAQPNAQLIEGMSHRGQLLNRLEAEWMVLAEQREQLSGEIARLGKLPES